MELLSSEIKLLIIDALNLEGMSVDDIDSQAALFGDGLGLDSIDAEGRTLPRLWNVHALCNGRSAFGIARLLGKAAVRPNPGACFHQ